MYAGENWDGKVAREKEKFVQRTVHSRDEYNSRLFSHLLG
jgi:hypothetical protein